MPATAPQQPIGFADVLRESTQRVPLGQSVGKPTIELCTLLMIQEVLKLGDLELSLLLDKSEDDDRIEFKLNIADSLTPTGALCHSYTL